MIAENTPTGGDIQNPRSRNLLQPNKSTLTPKRYKQGGRTLIWLQQIPRMRVLDIPPRGRGVGVFPWINVSKRHTSLLQTGNKKKGKDTSHTNTQEEGAEERCRAYDERPEAWRKFFLFFFFLFLSFWRCHAYEELPEARRTFFYFFFLSLWRCLGFLNPKPETLNPKP